jgi:hypothetical protein
MIRRDKDRQTDREREERERIVTRRTGINSGYSSCCVAEHRGAHDECTDCQYSLLGVDRDNIAKARCCREINK